jgi:CRP-like cAMP-binding protein
VIIWELIFSFVVMFNMFTVPLMLAFPKVSEKVSAQYLWLELILEIMWVLQIIQMCITADPPRTTTLNAIISKYAKSGMLFLDVIATVPSIILLIMRMRSVGKYFMLIRYAHAPQFFYPFQLYFDKVSKATKVKKQRLMALVQVFVFILVLDHFMACVWIILGGRDPEGGTTWLFANDMPDKTEHPIRVWATAFYWVFEVISTVGYGDFAYSSSPEYLFAILLEFIGVIFNAILVGTVMGVTSGDLNFDMLMTEKMDALLVWVKKIELCNKYIETKETQKSLDPLLYTEINRFVQDAFLYDFNLIVEEFEMYQKLPP